MIGNVVYVSGTYHWLHVTSKSMVPCKLISLHCDLILFNFLQFGGFESFKVDWRSSLQTELTSLTSWFWRWQPV